jgi:flagellar protein FliS
VDDFRSRYLRERVLTATPVQRVVLLYDRLALDLARAREAADPVAAGPHLGHAAQIVAELLTSLDASVGGPAANLTDLYNYLLRTLVAAQTGGAVDSLEAVESIVAGLRAAWTAISDGATANDNSLVGAVPGVAVTGSWTA